MADNKGNFIKRLGKKISDVFAELKRVTWPTGEKLAKTAAVVLLVIVFFAVYLTLIGNGGRWILNKVGFYDIVETTATTATTVAEETTVATEATEAAETSGETETSAEG
ncbi:MAG: preprotein translocase subunit SecE [Saccharofermentans sp.]|nr:preprotein translocase subunit SecE [Saccharofermentans sp.]